MSKAQEADITGNTKLAYFTHRLITIEKQIVFHKKIRYITSTTVNNNIKRIAIPKYEKLNWNNIPKKCIKTSGK